MDTFLKKEQLPAVSKQLASDAWNEKFKLDLAQKIEENYASDFWKSKIFTPQQD